MLITKIKPKEELDRFLAGNPFIIKCFGCKEVRFPEDEVNDLVRDIPPERVVRLDYLCREEFSYSYLYSCGQALSRTDSVIVFSCGVGVQVIAKLASDKLVYAGCDTCYLDGFQGLSIQGYNCDSCGECRLNETGGICPITACSKWLVNGQCGGAKNGKCEVTPEMPCGWELIYKRLALLGGERKMAAGETHIRNYHRIIKGETGTPK